MKRKTIIVGVMVCVAATALLALAWPAPWLAIAYQRSDVGEEFFHGKVDSMVREMGALIIYRKRASWLPGADYLMPDQNCMSCMNGHQACRRAFRSPTNVKASDMRDLPAGSQIYALVLAGSWSCTCEEPLCLDK